MITRRTILTAVVVISVFAVSLWSNPYWWPDLDSDGSVNAVDFAEFAGNWLQSGSGLEGDFDNSETVNASDLTYIARYWLADAGQLESYKDSLPYLTSFESYQGFALGDLDYQNGWQVHLGLADVNEEGSYQYIRIDPNSAVSKLFDDAGDADTYIRCQIYPGDDARVRILDDANEIAVVEFNADGDIHVLDGSSFIDTDVSWSPAYSELKFVMDYSSNDYDVFWNGSSVLTSNADFGVNSSTLTEVEFRTGDSDSVRLDRLSISDENGDGSETNWSITSPGGGGDDILEGRVPLKGHIWWDELGRYEIRFCPDDLDDSDPANWFTTYVGWNPVESGKTVGYWDTSAIPNGYYHLGIIVYDDTGSSSLGLQKLMSGAELKTFVIASNLKCNTFHHEEPADISVPWPGEFPFEFKRIYDNNRRFYSKPIRNGWTCNDQITLTEDSDHWYEQELGFPTRDGSILAYGQIWVTYPDGSRQLFLHDPEGTTNETTTIYKPYPENSSFDYIERTSDFDWMWTIIDGVQYKLIKRDGTVLSFKYVWLDLQPDDPWLVFGTLFGTITTTLQSKTDRFGNSLTYSWYGTQAVTLISDGTRNIDLDVSGGYYTQAQLKISSQVYRTVEYDWISGNKTLEVTKTGYGVDSNGVYDGGTPKEYVTQYQYDDGMNLIAVAYEGDVSDPSIEIEYDDYGRVATRNDYVDSNNYLETSYEYVFYHPDPGNENVSNLRTIATTPYQEIATIQDTRGNVLEQKTVTNDGSAVTDVNALYSDYQNPLKPTDVNEYFDGVIRKTWNDYNGYGDLIEQRVYVDDSNYITTEFAYHPDHSLQTRQTSWQGLNETGQKVERINVYGNANGTENTHGEYVVKHKILLSESPDVWAQSDYEYHANGLVQQKTDPNGFILSYDYDDNDYVKLMKMGTSGSLEAVARFHYDAIGQLRIEANHLGGVVLNDYDDFGRLWKVRKYEDADAMSISDAAFVPSRYEAMTPVSTEVFGYDQNGNATYEQTAASGEVSTSYTIGGLPKKITYDDGTYEEYHYDDRGLKTEEYKNEYSSGKDWSIEWSYDDTGRSTSTVWYDYDDTTILKALAKEYYGSGSVKKATAYGHNMSVERITDYYYDLLGRLTTTVVAPGELDLTTDYYYDAAGNRISVIDPNGSVIYFDYDNANRNIAEYFAAEIDADPNVKTQTLYYQNGLVRDVNSYDYDGTLLARTQYEYDARRRITKVIQDINDTEQVETVYGYDDSGFVVDGNEYQIRIEDANDRYTYIALDPFTRRVKTLYPSGDYEELLYNGDGTLSAKAVWDANDIKHWIEYYYDGYGRLIDVNYPDGGNVHYTFDGFGRKTLVEDSRNSTDNIGGSGEIAYQYDVLDRVQEITEQDGYQISYMYQGDDQKSSIIVTEPNDPNSILYYVEYNYDAANRLKSVTEPLLAALNDWIAEFTYDENGNRKQLEYFLSGSVMGTSVSIDYTYDRENHLTGFTTSGGPTFVLENVDVDGLGRLWYADETVTTTDGNTVDHSYTYTYDMLSRLRYAHGANVPPTSAREYAYDYDTTGNLTHYMFNNYSPDQEHHSYFSYTGDLRTGGSGGAVGWYDLNGRQTSLLDDDPHYYPLEYDWDGNLRYGMFMNPSMGMEAKYDPEGVRIYKHRIWNAGSYWHKYIVDTTDNLPEILLVLDANDNNTILKTYVHANDQVIAQHDGDVNSPRYFYLHDRLGSVRQIIDANGAVANCYYYTPWGGITGSESDETVSNWYGWAGYVIDEEIDSYYCNARQYNAARFMTRDPVRGSFREPMTLHSYLYCLNDPINKVDPSGEFFLFDFLFSRSWVAKMRAQTAAVGAGAMDFARRVWYMAYTRVIDLYNWAILNISGYGTGCFTADTEIYTPEGEVPIAEVNVGDLVWSYNQKTGETTQCLVVNVFKHDVNSLLIICVGDEVIETTSEHPFWVQGKEWVKASELVVGDNLFTSDSLHLSIEDIGVIEGSTIVYNLEVEGDHTYFVSQEQILVHNKAQWFPRWATRNIEQVYKHLEKYHGISKYLASERLHALKAALGLPADYDLIFDLTGNVYDTVGNLLGSLTQGGGG